MSATQTTRIDPPRRTRTNCRAPWRQRLVQAEHGLRCGLKADSVFFGYAFLSSMIAAIGLVVGLGWQRWSILVLAWTLVMTAELLNQAFRLLLNALPPEQIESTGSARGLAQAAVTLAQIGSCVAVACVFAEPVLRLFH